MPRTRSPWLREMTISLLLFGLVAALYLLIRVDRAPTDTSWTLPTSLSLLREGNLDLNEYPYAAGDPNGVLDVDGRLVSFFPIATPILVAPAVALAEALSPGADLYARLKEGADWLLIARWNLALASIITAGTVVVMYRALRRIHGQRLSLVVTVVFAFGTMMWSTASRDLWQHTLSAFTLALTLYFLLAARDQPRMVQFAGLSVALAYTIRPTNSISVIAVTVYVLLAYRRYLLRYLGWAALVAAPFLALNLAVYRSILPPYFLSTRLAIHPAMAEALLGNLISPARGLLVYAPVMLFATYGFARRARTRSLTGLDWTLAAILFFHWLAISSFWHWWGGASFGPRFFTDMLPFLTYFLAYGVAGIAEQRRPVRLALGASFAALALVSIAIHFRGVADERTWAWNGEHPKVLPSVDAAPERVWDWRDPQFARGLRAASINLDVAALRFEAPEGAQVTAPVTVTVRNLGDGPFMWEADLPRRLTQLPAESQVGPLSYSEMGLVADLAGLGVGCHPLGAVRIRAEDGAGWSAVDVAPVVVAIGEARPDCDPAPADILIDGRPQADAGGMRAFFGSGWYDREGAEPDAWRWTSSPARLLIYSPARASVRLNSRPVAVYDPVRSDGPAAGVLRVSVGSHEGRIPVEAGVPFAYPLDLQRGWNEVRLELEAGNFRPVDLDPATGDTRSLSFSLGPIDLVR